MTQIQEFPMVDFRQRDISDNLNLISQGCVQDKTILGGRQKKNEASPAGQCRRCGFDPWIRKILWRRKCQLSSILAWEMPWMEKHGRLQSMGSQSQSRLSMDIHTRQKRDGTLNTECNSVYFGSKQIAY